MRLSTIALVGEFDAGIESVFTAGVGRRVVDLSRGRVDVQSGTLQIYDPILHTIQSVFSATRIVPTEFTLWHTPEYALSTTNPSSPEWIGFLRTADALLLVVSCDGDLEIAAEQVSTLRMELALLDLAVIESAQARLRKHLESGPRIERRASRTQLELLEQITHALESSHHIGNTLEPHELVSLHEYSLLTTKPTVVALNVPDDAAAVTETKRSEANLSTWCVIAGSTEAELPDLPPEDIAAFQADLGMSSSAASRLGHAAQRALDFIVFYTGNSSSVNAWNLARGQSALVAARSIHSDLADGFVRADVASAGKLVEAGSWARLRELGELQRVGREYIVENRDVIEVHFSR